MREGEYKTCAKERGREKKRERTTPRTLRSRVRRAGLVSLTSTQTHTHTHTHIDRQTDTHSLTPFGEVGLRQTFTCVAEEVHTMRPSSPKRTLLVLVRFESRFFVFIVATRPPTPRRLKSKKKERSAVRRHQKREMREREILLLENLER